MRLNRELFALLFLLVLFIVGGVLLTGRDNTKSRQVGAEETHDPSVYNDRASGSRGCYEWVGKLGYRPTVWRRPWSTLSSSHASVLLVIDPQIDGDATTLTGSDIDQDAGDTKSTGLGARDVAPLMAWLRAGHTAIVMASRLPSGHTAGETGGDDTFADALDLVAETASPAGRQEFSPLQPTAETRSVLSIYSDADARFHRKSPDAVALFGDSAGPLVISLPVGAGHLIAVADSQFVSNSSLPRSENAVFLANVLAGSARPGTPILFDEYHHGDIAAESGATLWGALGRPLQLALIQGLLALIVLVAVVAVRFGTPVPLGQGVTRTSAEYVTSLATLYRRAQASTATLETLYRQFLRDLAARMGLAPDVNLEHLADVAARRGGIDKEALRQLLATCEQRMDDRKLSESELIDLARRMERIRKDIGIA
jgi:hypothetical protein